MLGTPAYLAPERLVDGIVLPGSDVYALGLLLYRMLAGRMPWSSETTIQMLMAHAYLAPPELPAIEGVPAEVADVCHRCLAKDPADRPSAAAVAAALTSVAGTAKSPRPAVPDARTAAGGDEEPGGRRLRRLAVLAAIVVVLVAGVLLLFGGPSGERDSADQPGGTGGIPAPGEPSFPGSGGAATVPGGGAPAGAGDPRAGTGAGTGIGVPGVPPAGAPGGPPAGGGADPPGTPDPTPLPNPVRRTANATGGSAVVECTGRLARLITWTPADGFEVQAVQPGPVGSVLVRFRAGTTLSSIQAMCVDGVPDITIR
jgi:serine/threonine-protein kinase